MFSNFAPLQLAPLPKIEFLVIDRSKATVFAEHVSLATSAYKELRGCLHIVIFQPGLSFQLVFRTENIYVYMKFVARADSILG